MELKASQFGREGHCFFQWTGTEIDIDVFDDEVTKEYAERCVYALNHMPEKLWDVICEAAKRYCLFSIALCKEAAGDAYDPAEFPPVTADTPAQVFRSYFQIGSMVIHKPEDPQKIGFTLSGSCDWEIEHGLEIDILEERVVYLGLYDGNSPWSEYDDQDEWNFVNGINQLD